MLRLYLPGDEPLIMGDAGRCHESLSPPELQEKDDMIRIASALALAAAISAAVYQSSYAAPIAPLPREQLGTNSDVTQEWYHHRHIAITIAIPITTTTTTIIIIGGTITIGATDSAFRGRQCPLVIKIVICQRVGQQW
jgi:hypothetical protein